MQTLIGPTIAPSYTAEVERANVRKPWRGPPGRRLRMRLDLTGSKAS